MYIETSDDSYHECFPTYCRQLFCVSGIQQVIQLRMTPVSVFLRKGEKKTQKKTFAITDAQGLVAEKKSTQLSDINKGRATVGRLKLLTQ